MSVIQTNTDIAPFVIKNFLGLNVTKTGDTQIKDGESGNMDNFVITNDYKLKKADGYKTVYDFGTQIKGLYEYKTGTETYLIIATKQKNYVQTLYFCMEIEMRLFLIFMEEFLQN